ncbi:MULTISPECIES: MFS transporter [Streptomyces]|uniref:MFS transporter n=2 Tax=Streptomyces TaxID=1883 RepID=A0A2U9P520_STRAS|nr:MFS transporter [Streptomyces actuosus]AWT44756.1 MFS transporter [Streptomyces actuosus]MBM4821299.1 MFS transporter [Streptomyces actuosus]
MTQILHETETRSSPPLPARTRWAILGVVLAADVLDLLDSTITTIAAPTITADLGGGHALVQWLGAAYALALGVLLVPGGRLGDRYGRRRMFLLGLAGFTVASVACGLAPTPAALVVARLAQGAFGALLIPQGFGILGATWPRDQIGKAFSLFGPVMGLSAVGGPVLAAFLVDADLAGLGWRAMFLINLVLGGAALLAAHRLLPRDTGDRGTAVDGLGSLWLAGAMLGLLGGLIDGSAHGWTAATAGVPRPLALLLLGLALFAAFCRRQRTAPDPLIRPTLLRNRGFTSGLLLGVVAFAAVAGLLYAVSLHLQQGLGRSPTGTAVALIPLCAGIVVASIACHGLIQAHGRRLVAVGLLLVLAGCGWLLALTAGSVHNGWALVPPLLLTGLGMGCCFGTVYDVTIGDIDPAEAGSASGSLNAVQQLANAVGAAAVTTVYFHSLHGHGEAHAMTVSLTVVAASIAGCLGLVRLLPRKAPQEQHH